jgi:Zn-dependent protease with chaperone function
MRFRRHQEAAAAASTRLLLLFVAVVLATVVAVNALLYLAWLVTVPMAARLPALFFETNTALVLLFVLGGSWVESLALREGGAHVARLAGARPAQTAGHADAQRLERRFVNVVQEMALAAGARPPAAWVLARDDAINAFAAGWAADDAVIAVTRGALERLTRAELQGVVAHELSHLVHEDTRLNMRLIGLVWGLQMVHGFGRTLAASDEQGRRGPGVLFGLALIVVGWVGWLAGRVLQASVSRQREFLADASAVKYTRLVDGIGGALRKIAGENPPGRPARHPASLSHLWLAAPSAPAVATLRQWLATHPPLAERLRRLYGRPVPALAAEVLAAADDEPVPASDAAAPLSAALSAALSGFAPRLPPAARMARGSAAAARMGTTADAASHIAGDTATANPVGPATTRTARARPHAAAPTPGPSEASRFDATQHPDRSSASEREAEALQRIGHWHSRGERHAALLALLIADDAAAAPWPAWRAATAAWPVAEAVRTEVQALGPAARLQTFETLVRRTAEAGDGRSLWRAACTLATSDAARLRLWVLRRGLRPPPPTTARLSHGETSLTPKKPRRKPSIM